jgi:hypothetical protein
LQSSSVVKVFAAPEQILALQLVPFGTPSHFPSVPINPPQATSSPK